MSKAEVTVGDRKVGNGIYVLDIAGEINAYAENDLMEAYTRVNSDSAKWIIMNFINLEYMNSSGIGLLVTLLIRVQRQKQHLLAFGLTDHYRQIFELTRLDEAIMIFDDETSAVKAANGS